MAEKNYRIKANVGEDIVLKAHLHQDIDFLEVLSLKINQSNTYKLHTSNYGIIVGRILANEAFGIPNAKVSVFIKLSDEDSERSDIINLYPYVSINSKDGENRRYNLLPDSSNNDCYRIVGTFPNKRLVLDNETYIEIFDKYWKYTTVTNQSGDYMIFGVPTGNQTIHVDIDLSDIGILSQKPRDFYYKGYNQEQFDSAEQFKTSTNLNNLSQIISQNTSVHVYPFFGDKEMGDIAISRCDVEIPYKFEPTCVFLGSIISDKGGEHIGHACGPSRWIGYNGRMVTGEGTIEMIRRTPDGLVEEFPIKANRLIDSDGVWCYQIPMNLDYIGTDEFGNIIPVQDSTKGIPTRTSVRFRISLQETKGEASTEHVAKYLVPNTQELDPSINIPHILNGRKYNNCFEFGSATPKEHFRDLLWNKVYTVKNYIPRIQMSASKNTRNYGGVRSVNNEHANNVFPFNSAYFRLTFAYKVLCTLFCLFVDLVGFYNKLISEIICWDLSFRVLGKKIKLLKPLNFLSKWIKCVGFKGGDFFEEREHIVYYPKCDRQCGKIIEGTEGKIVLTDKDPLKDVIQQTLALEYDVVNLDFYNDWINGTLYMPLWFWKKRKKKKYFFGLFSKKSVNTFCSCDKGYDGFKVRQACQDIYNALFLPLYEYSGNKNYHRDFTTGTKSAFWGVIKEFINKDDLKIYYYSPGSPNAINYREFNGSVDYTRLFETDIVLLGSLNTCDLDNLPQAFVGLPNTTANIPFIASFTEANTDEDNIDDPQNNSDTSFKTFVPGLDWEHNGDYNIPKFGKGLLMDLTCWHVYTRFKSCVNLNRMSELDVALDMDIVSDDPSEPTIYHDGLITNKEIVYNETRAKFASLNHNGLTNLTKNITTNYDTYKFHYIYPTNFNGHLYRLAPNYTQFYSEITQDITDNNYVKYRLGEGKDSSLQIRHKKHFYWGHENAFSFPLYNNSFYFYFGLKEGKTAIDKFYSTYYASCASQNKFPFTIEYVAKPGKWCYNIENNKTDFGTIDIQFEGMTSSFSYTLFNEFNEELISETDVISEDLRFGYDIKEGGGEYIVTSQDGYKKEGRLKEFKTGKLVTNSLGENVYLENGVYYLQVTNSIGMSNTIRINMIQNPLMPNFEEIKLGTKYTQGLSNSASICGDMDFHGELRLKSFIVDGEEVFITSCVPFYRDNVKRYYVINNEVYYAINGKVSVNEDEYEEQTDTDGYFINIDGVKIRYQSYEEPKELTCRVECTDGSSLYVVLEPEGSENTNISDFVCYGVGNVPSTRLEELGDGIFTLIFNIWKPGDYIITITQICNDVMNDNVSVNTFSIENGETFQAYINDVPLKIIYNDNFQKNDNGNIPQAWLNLENPLMYNMRGTTNQDIDFWGEIIDITTENINNQICMDVDSKIKILQYQLSSMGKMKNGAYIINDAEIPSYTITTKGGKEPILIRNLHPNFLDFENGEICQNLLLENSNIVEAPSYHGYIIDERYSVKNDFLQTNKGVRLNNISYGNNINQHLGNYFAAFTNNGGLIELNSGCKVSDDLFYQSSPDNASVMSRYCSNIAQILSTYPMEVVNGNTSYMRTMFIDKRMSLNGELFYPIISNYNLGDDTWQRGNVKMDIYGGVPMAFDEEYNIIGDTDNAEYSIFYRNNPNEEYKIFDGEVEKLRGNTDVKLQYNTDSPKYYYSTIYDVDGESIDLTKECKVTISREITSATTTLTKGELNVPLVQAGIQVTCKIASCQMRDDLEYDITNEGENYTFKSYVEEGNSIDISLQSGNRIILEDGEVTYRALNSGKYIIVNGKKCPIITFDIDNQIFPINKGTITINGKNYGGFAEKVTTYTYEKVEYGIKYAQFCKKMEKGQFDYINYIAYPWNNNPWALANNLASCYVFNTYVSDYYIRRNDKIYYYSENYQEVFNDECSQINISTTEVWGPIWSSIHYTWVTFMHIAEGDENIYLIWIDLPVKYALFEKKKPEAIGRWSVSYPQKYMAKSEDNEIEFLKEQLKKTTSTMREYIISGNTNNVTLFFELKSSFEKNKTFNKQRAKLNPLNNKWYITENNQPIYLYTVYGETINTALKIYPNVEKIDGVLYEHTYVVNKNLGNADMLPHFPDNVKSGYCFYETTIDDTSDISSGITIDGVVYAVYEDILKHLTSHSLNEFKCKVVKDSFNDYFDKIECTSPILISGYDEQYGIPNRIGLEEYAINEIPWFYFNGTISTDMRECKSDGDKLAIVSSYLRETVKKSGGTEVKIWDLIPDAKANFSIENSMYLFEGKMNKNNYIERINTQKYGEVDRISLLNYQGYILTNSQKFKTQYEKECEGSQTIGVLLPYVESTFTNNDGDEIVIISGNTSLSSTSEGIVERVGYIQLPLSDETKVAPENGGDIIGYACVRTNIFVANPMYGLSGETPSIIYESDEVADYITHILREPTLLKKENKILTCALIKTYYRDDTEDKLSSCISTQNLNAQWDIRDLYITDGKMVNVDEKNKVVFGIYYSENYANKDIWENLLSSTQLMCENSSWNCEVKNRDGFNDSLISCYNFDNCGVFYPNVKGSNLLTKDNVTYSINGDGLRYFMYVGQLSNQYGLWEGDSLIPLNNNEPMWRIRLFKDQSNGETCYYQYENTNIYKSLNQISGTTSLSSLTQVCITRKSDADNVYTITNDSNSPFDVLLQIAETISGGQEVIIEDMRKYSDNFNVEDVNSWYVPCKCKITKQRQIKFNKPYMEDDVECVLAYEELHIKNIVYLNNDDIFITQSSTITPSFFDKNDNVSCVLLLQYDVMSLVEEEIYGIECSDGYYYFGAEHETIQRINSQGEIENVKLKEMEKSSFVGEQIFHLEKGMKTSDRYHGFVSIVEKGKKMSEKKYIEVLIGGTVQDYEEKIFDLSFNIANMKHKISYKMINGILKCQ